jgi:hypothetical protein
MQQLLHLLIVDRDRREALATMHGSRWLLPIACCTERTRAGPLAARWIAEHGVTGYVIGQWLGRVAPANDAMDWLVVVDACRSRQAAAPPNRCWTALERLQDSASLLDYQTWAVEKAGREDLPCVAGPFGSMTWFDDAREWMNVVAGGPLTGSPICYKATPYEVVVGIAAACGTVYFKGLTGDRVAEATLTSTLARELPGSFARTLALERRADASVWWLTADCSGTTLAADLTRERTVLVAANLARIQRHLIGRTSGLGIPEADLASAAAWALALVFERADSETAIRCEASLARVHRTVGTADLPRSWIPLDLDAGNVVIDDESVRFIDLDESRIGSVPLALSTLLRRLKRRRASSASPLRIDAMQRAYERSWMPCLQLRERWSDLETASVLLECHTAWQQLRQKTERGEVHGALDLAATYTAQRLARALDKDRDASADHGRR